MASTPAELVSRADHLARQAQDRQDEADALLIEAELIVARQDAQRRLKAAERKAEQLRAVADNCEAESFALAEDLKELQRRLTAAQAVADSPALVSQDEPDHLAAEIDAEMVTASIERRLAKHEPLSTQARDAANAAQLEAELAARDRDEAAAGVAVISDALKAPLQHERARQTRAWELRAARDFAAIVTDPDRFTPEHLGVAIRMLQTVLASKAGEQAAIEAVARWKARRLLPQFEPTDDGNLRFMQVRTLMPGANLAAGAAAAQQAAAEAHALGERVGQRPVPVTGQPGLTGPGKG